jgi:hypothetical protein
MTVIAIIIVCNEQRKNSEQLECGWSDANWMILQCLTSKYFFTPIFISSLFVETCCEGVEKSDVSLVVAQIS